MTRLITLLYILLLLTSKINAQNPANGTFWHYNQVEKGGKNGKSYSYSINKDTTINQKACKIIKGGFGCGKLPIEGEVLYYEGKKIFWYDKSLNSFKLLYDFGANAGDILKIGLQKGSSTLFDVKVDSIKDITIGSEVFRIQYLKLIGPLFDYVFGGEAVERAGCAFNFFPQFGACDPLQNGGLRCYTEPNKAFFKITPDECENPTNALKASPSVLTQINVYPNPFSKEITIENKNEDILYLNIRLINTMGQTIYNHYTSETITHLGLSDIPQGIYFLEIRDNKHSKIEKIIKSDY